MKRAAVFAGQGAQFVGMGRDLAESYAECRALFEEADRVLGYALARLCFEGPLEELTRSDRCQPAIFVTSLACLRALGLSGPALAWAGTAGLSLGEWTALHVAGVLSFADTLRVLEARGRFMQEACAATAGGMVSVLGLGVDKLEAICAAAGCQIANLNSPEQTVLSGTRDSVAAAERLAKEAGAKRTVPLKVAGAFHSALMQPAAVCLEAFLAGVEFRAPSFPVIANVTGRPHGTPAEIRQTMVRQVTSPVHWVASVEWLHQSGVQDYVECGPGSVLAGLIKRIDKDARVRSIQDVPTLQKALGGQ
jgi:[acyl-carrier-protein] S-malonyltransferase